MAKRVLITGAAGQIAYSLVFAVARGDLFGPNQSVILHLLDIEMMKDALQGIVLELEDSAFPTVAGVVATTNVQEAFTGVDYALLVGSMPRREGMERSDLLKINGGIFKEQGKALADHASPNVKVLVVGNPANTNALVALHSAAPKIPKENFSALTRLDHNRAKAQIALRLKINPSQVHNVIIWGNHSSTQYPDVSHAYVTDYPNKGDRTPVTEAIKDEKWLHDEFIKTVQQRGAAVIKLRKFSSAASAAKAIIDHVKDWVFGTHEDEFVSMAVISDGNHYNIEKDLIFSFPVRIKDGKYHIVEGLQISEFSKGLLKATQEELVSEKELAFKHVNQ